MRFDNPTCFKLFQNLEQDRSKLGKKICIYDHTGNFSERLAMQSCRPKPRDQFHCSDWLATSFIIQSDKTFMKACNVDTLHVLMF